MKHVRTLVIGIGIFITGLVCLTLIPSKKPTRPAAATAPNSLPAIQPGTNPSNSNFITAVPNPPAPKVTLMPTPTNKTEEPPAFKAFSDWATQHLAGTSSLSEPEAEALAWHRRQAMLELIQNDPQRALALTVPFRWRTELPTRITRHFEQQLDGRGALEVAMAEVSQPGKQVYRWAVLGRQRFDAYVYGRRVSQNTRSDIPLHGIVLENKMAVLDEPLRVLEPDEALKQSSAKTVQQTCSVCSQAVDYPAHGLAAEIGGATAYFCSDEHLNLVSQQWSLASFGSAGNAGAQLTAGGGSSTWTQGRKNLLYMRVNFPDDLTEPVSEADAYQAMDEVNRFYVEGSYDTTWITTTVTPLLTLPQVKAWYSTAGPLALLSDARDTARKAGFDTVNYNLDIVSHTTVPDFDWGGLGYVGAKGTWLQAPYAGVTAHELGHNYGLRHANFWDTITNFCSVIGPGINSEYGNVFDTMGNAGAENNQFGAFFKNQLKWLPDPNVHNIASNGIYRIYPFDLPQRINGHFYAAKIQKDYDRDYWLEFRQTFNNVSLQNGILLNWSPWTQSDGVDMLDTTPETLDRSDSAVVIGRTFNDEVAGIHITPVSRSNVKTDPWIDVQVNLGSFPGNWPPLLKIEIDRTNASPGELIHFHATASDVNGDTLAWAWSFDDGTFSTNNQPWAAKSWADSGEHVVRCVVSDMKGGIASVNRLVTIGQPNGFRISGIILDANNNPVEGVLVDNGITNEFGHVFSYTDSDGYFVILATTNQLSLDATKYGYAFTNLNWENPLQLSSNVGNANFYAALLPNVHLSLTTNVLTEGSGASTLVTLTRTGSTNDDLTVPLFVSGTATLLSDYTITPPLAVRTNNVIIPAGTNSVTFQITTINNSTVESTETVYLTITDASAFVIAPAAEARIMILDDDVPVQPAVSISVAQQQITEAGGDNGLFIFSRTGPTTSSLPVFYSVSGTATSGSDFSPPVGVVIIPAGSRSATVELKSIDDKDVESDETIILTVIADTTYSGGGASATLTLVDDDLLVVSVTPTQTTLAEPTTPGRFTIKRDGDQSVNLVVYYTLSGAASNGIDYISPSGAVTIPAGQPSADVVITPINDNLLEGDESVVLTLTGNPGYDIGTPGSATLAIRDDEKFSVSITATDGAAAEPGSDFGAFRISRGTIVNGDLTINLAINGTALAGSDYLPLDNPVVIPDGQSFVTLDLIPFDDLQIEPFEDVILTLLPSTNYNLGTSQARVMIADNDGGNVPAVGFTFTSSSVLEHEFPGVSVSLSYTSAVPVTVNYKIVGGTASANDYTLNPGPLTFYPGERAKSLPLVINDDSTVEANETIRFILFDPQGATHDGNKTHTLTIIDNDLASISVAALVSLSETNGTPGIFRITRTGNTNASQVVNFQITGTASAPSDFVPLGNSAVIPAGTNSVDLPVVPTDDATVELDQTVVLTLTSAPGGKIISPNSATVIIGDNDPNALPVVSISSTNHPYALEGGGNSEFVISRTGPLTNSLTIYLTRSGTAFTSDYLSLTNSVTLTNGQAAIIVPITAVDDNLVEGDETVIASLTLRDTYRISFSGTATVIIQDNDQKIRVDASDFESAEPGTDLGAFTFTRFGTTNTAVQVFFALSGTASNGVDYSPITSPVTIPAGSLSTTVPLVPLNDSLVEGAELVTLTLQTNSAYVLDSPATATAALLDDEPMFSIVAGNTNLVEGSQMPGVFRVIRGGDPTYEITAHLMIGGTSTYGVDYPAFSTNLFFNCGVMAIELLVFPTNELAVEGLETVTATLVPNPAYTLLAPSNAVITISDPGTNATQRGPLVAITSPIASPVFLLGTNVNLILEANITDDGDTNTPLTLVWTNVAGPGSIVFGNTDQTNTTASFTNSGVYVLRLTADENQITNYAEVTVLVDTLGVLSSTLLHWTFDEGSGTNVIDVSGHAHNGIITGPANWSTNGILGGALRLNGTNNLVTEALSSGFLNGLKQFTFSLWVKAEFTNQDRGLFTANSAGTPTLSLAARHFASCGSSSNVVEATLATTRGETQRLSPSNRLTNEWQQLTLNWSDGQAPALFINGELDQPGKQMSPLRGMLTNSAQFIIGQGPVEIPNTWQGFVDDVRVFPRVLQPVEISGLVASNYGPVIVVPTNLVVQVITPVDLIGLVTDDARPNPPGVPSNTWIQISGPAPITLQNSNALTNTVEFTVSGDYVFRLISDDGQVKVYQDLKVTVVEPTSVSVTATDGEAAELGPDPGEFKFSRVGDLNFALTMQVMMSGTASNGVDMAYLTTTNTVTLPVGVDSVVIPVIPFLDHRTEGNETVTFTIITNVAYTVASAEATVTIHDSPYGVWNIAHFTLEELTDPSLSGEPADFDHDGRGNFVEYAFNREPKTFETNSPLTTALELNPADSQNHITLTYQRRLEPTDVHYEVRVSNNLLTWNTGTNYIQEFQRTDDGNNLTETVKARLVSPWPSGTNQFLSIRVWLRTTGQ